MRISILFRFSKFIFFATRYHQLFEKNEGGLSSRLIEPMSINHFIEYRQNVNFFSPFSQIECLSLGCLNIVRRVRSLLQESPISAMKNDELLKGSIEVLIRVLIAIKMHRVVTLGTKLDEGEL